MKPLIDLHTHTIVSGHAYSTMHEMAAEASARGLQILGITEHGPQIPGTCDPIYFRNLHVVPRVQCGVRLLLGVELNILDTTGRLDLDERHMQCCDLRIAGIHRLCWQGGSRTANTDGVLAAIHNPWTHIISHPADGTAELHFEPLVRAAAETHTLLEVNSCSLMPARHMTGARENNLELLRISRRLGVPIILASDAHITYSIADYSNVLPLLAETDFPDELILNWQPERAMEYLGIDLKGVFY